MKKATESRKRDSKKAAISQARITPKTTGEASVNPASKKGQSGRSTTLSERLEDEFRLLSPEEQLKTAHKYENWAWLLRRLAGQQCPELEAFTTGSLITEFEEVKQKAVAMLYSQAERIEALTDNNETDLRVANGLFLLASDVATQLEATFQTVFEAHATLYKRSVK